VRTRVDRLRAKLRLRVSASGTRECLVVSKEFELEWAAGASDLSPKNRPGRKDLKHQPSGAGPDAEPY
jgi:hypothetical protein